MSVYSNLTLLRKIRKLNTSQQSIETLSLWIIHHIRNYVPIVNTWRKEFEEVSENKKIKLIYLANDVIQNSQRKGPEYSTEFASILPQVFTSIQGDNPSLIQTVNRILDIWSARNVYSMDVLAAFRACLLNGNRELNAENMAGEELPDSVGELMPKRSRTSTPIAEFHEQPSTSASTLSQDMSRSGQTPMGVVSSIPREILMALQSLENLSSADHTLIGRVPDLPVELLKTPMGCLQNINDRNDAHTFLRQVTEAINENKHYTVGLLREREQRKKCSKLMHDFYVVMNSDMLKVQTNLEKQRRNYAHLLNLHKHVLKRLNTLPEVPGLPAYEFAGDFSPSPDDEV